MWARLCSWMVSANLAGFLVAIWVARWVRAVPETSGQETALLFAYYASMVVIGAIDALLADELVFGGAFRRTVLEGQSTRFLKRDADVEDVALGLRATGMSFPVMVLLGTGVTYLLYNAVNDDFDTYYRRVGKDVGIVVHGDPQAQIAAIPRIARHRGDDLPRVIVTLQDALQRGGEVGRWAAWGMGTLADQPRKRPLIAPLHAAVRAGDPALRNEALIALGRLQHRASADAIVAEVKAQHAAGSVDPRLLFALGSVQVLSSQAVLTELLYQADEATQGLAGWALAQHRDQRDAQDVARILEERLLSATFPVRCDLVHALGIFADERSNLVLMRAYEAASEEERLRTCARRSLSLRPDGDLGDRVDLFLPEDAFAMKVIASMAQMRATSPTIRAEVEPWLETVTRTPTADPAARTAAQTLLEGIREQRDDSGLPSVDQALGLDRSTR